MEIKITLCLEEGTIRLFRDKLETIEHMLIEIQHKEKKIMTQLDDLNAKLDAATEVTDAAGAALTKLAADSEKAWADLKAAIAAGPPPSVDLTAAMAKVDATNAKLQAIKDGVNSLDAEAIAADVPPAA
jgi:chromosome segregation ATPase